MHCFYGVTWCFLFDDYDMTGCFFYCVKYGDVVSIVVTLLC